MDCVVDGNIPKDKAEDWVIVCGVFIAASANDNKKIYKNNYEATKQAIKNALKKSPTIDEIIAEIPGRLGPPGTIVTADRIETLPTENGE